MSLPPLYDRHCKNQSHTNTITMHQTQPNSDLSSTSSPLITCPCTFRLHIYFYMRRQLALLNKVIVLRESSITPTASTASSAPENPTECQI